MTEKKKIDWGGPAFARPFHMSASGDWSNEQEGMMLRDYLAAKAMPAILQEMVKEYRRDDNFTQQIKKVSGASYIVADAMIKARKEEN